jgi:hypothetical protein
MCLIIIGTGGDFTACRQIFSFVRSQAQSCRSLKYVDRRQSARSSQSPLAGRVYSSTQMQTFVKGGSGCRSAEHLYHQALVVFFQLLHSPVVHMAPAVEKLFGSPHCLQAVQ